MKQIHRLLLSLLSGILLSFPWLGLPGWVLFVAFVPLLILDNYFLKYKTTFPVASFWGYTFLTFLVWNIASSWWMAKVSVSGVGTAMVLNAFVMSLVWWAAHSIRRNHSSRLGYIALVVFWISLEYFQFNWDIEWPCLQLGSGLAWHVEIIQWYEYTGTFGGTFWILALNILAFRLALTIRQKQYNRVYRINLVIFLILLVVPLFFSMVMYSSYKEAANPKTIAIVQPNVDPYGEQFDMDAETDKLENFLRLAGEVTTDETDIIVGPETVFENQWYWNEDSFKTNGFLQRINVFQNKFKKAETVFGVSSFKVYPNKEKATITARNKDGVIYDRFNTALYLNREGQTQVYHKTKLVSGVEKTPFLRHLPFAKDFVIDLGGAYGTLGQQKEASNFTLEGGTRVAPVICFESVFGAYVTEYVKKGAELIVIITNDGWWKNSRGYKQHLLFSQLRAIETRRSIARAANTGTSCFINQRGDVIQPTAWWKEAAIKGTVNANNELTFYVKHGDYLGRGAVFISVLLVLFFLVKRFK
ncbi:apolipoprotein N-acyltransferase [Prolixibacteraceae bacterium Z1-6]|uniref:Apolipoprotein N-acyltransferase n=1 Tax=Draconibacterium aestuarii TaxID=2998507 RepID=A0A9X3F3R9_9BACT|nr:apolipoprotein N-acyltransferase [Prolixibacteraceae bacterium Z1-6]